MVGKAGGVVSVAMRQAAQRGTRVQLGSAIKTLVLACGRRRIEDLESRHELRKAVAGDSRSIHWTLLGDEGGRRGIHLELPA